ncbi:MAG: 2-amino-4-hydroxy-6-hydroxymethyldihydropteridine diphosphokinase [Holophagaceae bacterium]|nr:2-amino-4-hydroxy-6-hydroxymethyldihydropteridine diphosphokinase [Holophagaceae bacterium]
MTQPLKAVIALGSNLGDRRAHLEAGMAALGELGYVKPSPLIMESKDESGLGPDYLNTVVLLAALKAHPREILEDLLRIELRLGRDRREGRNAPRTLDLDLIAVAGFQGLWLWGTPADLAQLGPQLELELPHPRAFERTFVLEPWRALGPSGVCGGVVPRSL